MYLLSIRRTSSTLNFLKCFLLNIILNAECAKRKQPPPECSKLSYMGIIRNSEQTGKFFLELHNRIFLPAVVETVRVPASLVVLPLPQDRVSDVSAGLNEKSIHSEDPVGGQRGHQLGNQTENLFRWHFIRHWCSQICELKASRSVL